MRKLETKNKILLFILSVIVLIIVILINWDNITLPKYEFTDSGYSIGSKIDIDGLIYEEINEDIYNQILKEIDGHGTHSFDYRAIGKIDYEYNDYVWKYKIYGNKSLEERLLLIGKEAYTFNDANYPDLFFCRQDILNSYNNVH